MYLPSYRPLSPHLQALMLFQVSETFVAFAPILSRPCSVFGTALALFFSEWRAGLHLWLWEHGAERPQNRTMLRRTDREEQRTTTRETLLYPPARRSLGPVSTKFDTIHEMDKFLSPQVLQVPSGPWQTCKIGVFSAAWVIFWSVFAFFSHCRAKKKKKGILIFAVFISSIQELAMWCTNMWTSAYLYLNGPTYHMWIFSHAFI